MCFVKNKRLFLDRAIDLETIERAARELVEHLGAPTPGRKRGPKHRDPSGISRQRRYFFVTPDEHEMLVKALAADRERRGVCK